MEDDLNKNIDESWKEAAEKEKSEADLSKDKQEIPDFDVTFTSFVTSLGLQTLIALGEIDSPVSGKKEENIAQAKFLIDTLDMISQKTKNNLTEQETEMLEGFLYELRMKFVTKQSGGIK